MEQNMQKNQEPKAARIFTSAQRHVKENHPHSQHRHQKVKASGAKSCN
jgi:hypothetical protein